MDQLILVAVLIILFVLFVTGFFVEILIVNEGEAIVIERLGIYQKVMYPGIHVLVPLLHAKKKVNWTYKEENGNLVTKKDARIPVKKQVIFDPAPMSCITRDRIKVIVNVVVTYRIVDVKKAVYEVDDLYRALHTTMETTIQQNIQKRTLDDISISREDIVNELKSSLDITKTWGLEIIKIQIQSLSIPNSIMETTERQMTQEKENETKKKAEKIRLELELLKEESDLQIQVKRQRVLEEKYRADAENMMIEARAEHARLELLFKGSPPTKIGDYLVQKLHTDALLKTKNRVVIVPYGGNPGGSDAASGVPLVSAITDAMCNNNKNALL